MEQNNNQEATSFMPLIPRLDRLDRLLQVIEEKHSFSRRSFGVNNISSCESDGYKTISSALEEVQYKGTLLDRLALLETRVLQLSLDMDEENTSKSSSSTFQVLSDSTGKSSAELSIIPGRLDDNTRAEATQEDESAAHEGESGTRITEEHKIKCQKRKSKKGLGLFGFRIIC